MMPSVLLIAGDAPLTRALASGWRGPLVIAGEGGADALSRHPLTFDDPARLRDDMRALGPFAQMVVVPGRTLYRRFLDTTDEQWDDLLTRSFERALWAAQAFAHAQIAAGRGGSIVFLSSVAAAMPFIGMGAQGTAQAALRALARMAAVDLGPHGLTVNVVECGWLAADTARLTDEARAHIAAGTPTGRLIDIGEVQGVCAFLASPAARSITGSVITLDGGYSLTRSDGDEALLPNAD